MIPATSIAQGEHATVVIVDIQERLAAVMEERDRVLAGVSLLTSVASITGVPIVVTRQYPKGLGGLEAVVADAVAQAEAQGCAVSHVDKMSFDCFGEPEFAQAVCATGRRQLLICGMESHICVAQTALTALREGFDVHVVADACCSRTGASHDIAMQRLSCAGAVVTVAESVAYELVGRAGTPDFKRLLAAVKA